MTARYMLAALAALLTTQFLWTSSANAQANADDRKVQFRSIDLATNTVELFNFGNVDVDLSGWRLCSHDDVDAFDYSSTSGLNGTTIEAGTSLFIHWDNDAIEDADNLNLSTLGGNNADLNADAFSIAIYVGGSFGASANMVDSLQWSVGGVFNALADARTSVAQSGGLWVDLPVADDEWISIADTSGDTITLDDATGGLLHGPSDYTVTPIPEPAGAISLVLGGLIAAWARKR